jgi:hypothetical protein
VEGLTLIKSLCNPIDADEPHEFVTYHLHVASVVETFTVKFQVLVTVLSNSALNQAVDNTAYIPYFSSSIQPSVVLAISPVALSILIRSPH